MAMNGIKEHSTTCAAHRICSAAAAVVEWVAACLSRLVGCRSVRRIERFRGWVGAWLAGWCSQFTGDE